MVGDCGGGREGSDGRLSVASHRPGVNDIGGSGEVRDEGAELLRCVDRRFLRGGPCGEERDWDLVALSADLPCAPLLNRPLVSNLITGTDDSNRSGTSLKEHDLRLKLC